MKRLFVYEPKPVPVLDCDGNPIGYKYPRVIPCTLKDSDEVRIKPFPNERGLSADPNNVAGFKALIDTINANRNLQGSGFSDVGFDILSSVQQVVQAERSLSDFESN